MNDVAMAERTARDEAMRRVAENPDNQYYALCAIAVRYVTNLPHGSTITASDVRAHARILGVAPRDGRVNGPLMKHLESVGLISRAGTTTMGRSHCGIATLWMRRA